MNRQMKRQRRKPPAKTDGRLLTKYTFGLREANRVRGISLPMAQHVGGPAGAMLDIVAASICACMKRADGSELPPNIVVQAKVETASDFAMRAMHRSLHLIDEPTCSVHCGANKVDTGLSAETVSRLGNVGMGLGYETADCDRWMVAVMTACIGFGNRASILPKHFAKVLASASDRGTAGMDLSPEWRSALDLVASCMHRGRPVDRICRLGTAESAAICESLTVAGPDWPSAMPRSIVQIFVVTMRRMFVEHGADKMNSHFSAVCATEADAVRKGPKQELYASVVKENITMSLGVTTGCRFLDGDAQAVEIAEAGAGAGGASLGYTRPADDVPPALVMVNTDENGTMYRDGETNRSGTVAKKGVTYEYNASGRAKLVAWENRGLSGEALAKMIAKVHGVAGTLPPHLAPPVSAGELIRTGVSVAEPLVRRPPPRGMLRLLDMSLLEPAGYGSFDMALLGEIRTMLKREYGIYGAPSGATYDPRIWDVPPNDVLANAAGLSTATWHALACTNSYSRLILERYGALSHPQRLTAAHVFALKSCNAPPRYSVSSMEWSRGRASLEIAVKDGEAAAKFLNTILFSTDLMKAARESIYERLSSGVILHVANRPKNTVKLSKTKAPELLKAAPGNRIQSLAADLITFWHDKYIEAFASVRIAKIILRTAEVVVLTNGKKGEATTVTLTPKMRGRRVGICEAGHETIVGGGNRTCDKEAGEGRRCGKEMTRMLPALPGTPPVQISGVGSEDIDIQLQVETCLTTSVTIVFK